MAQWEQARRAARKDPHLVAEAAAAHEARLADLADDPEALARYMIEQAEGDIEDPILEGDSSNPAGLGGAASPTTGGALRPPDGYGAKMGGVPTAMLGRGAVAQAVGSGRGGESAESLKARIALATQLEPTSPEQVVATAGLLRRAPSSLDMLTTAGKPSFVSLVPAGYRSWAEVAAKESSNRKRDKRSAAKLAAERAVPLNLRIKAPNPVSEGREPTRRQTRVASNLARVLEGVLGRREVKDPLLCVGGVPIEIADVEVTPCLRIAYVRWMLPFPVRAAPLSGDATFLGVAPGQSHEDAEEEMWQRLYGNRDGRGSGTGKPGLDGSFPLQLSDLSRAGLSASRGGASYGLPQPRSSSAARMISAIAERHAHDRGMARVEAPSDDEDRAALRLPLRRAPKASGLGAKMSRGAAMRDFYGDEKPLGHLPPTARVAVAQITEALRRNGPALRRAVGVELGMRYMPELQWHRYVSAETDEAVGEQLDAAERLTAFARRRAAEEEEEGQAEEDGGASTESDEEAAGEEGSGAEEDERSRPSVGRRRARRVPRYLDGSAAAASAAASESQAVSVSRGPLA
jgi:ribosome-binding factor A